MMRRIIPFLFLLPAPTLATTLFAPSPAAPDRLGTETVVTSSRDNFRGTNFVLGPADGGSASPYNVRRYVSLDSADRHDLNAEVNIPFQDLRLTARYTYLNAELSSSGNLAQFMHEAPRHRFQLGLGWQTGNRLSLWSAVEYNSAARGGSHDRTPAHAVFNMGATYQFNPKLSGAIAIGNLFDKQVNSARSTDVLDGREYSLSLAIKF